MMSYLSFGGKWLSFWSNTLISSFLGLEFLKFREKKPLEVVSNRNFAGFGDIANSKQLLGTSLWHQLQDWTSVQQWVVLLQWKDITCVRNSPEQNGDTSKICVYAIIESHPLLDTFLFKNPTKASKGIFHELRGSWTQRAMHESMKIPGDFGNCSRPPFLLLELHGSGPHGKMRLKKTIIVCYVEC